MDQEDIFNIPAPKDVGFIYAIQFNDFIKIGKSKNPFKRLKQIDITKLPYEPKLLYLKETDNVSQLEEFIFNVFRDYRLRGEWFSVEILNAIVKDCNDGKVDLKSIFEFNYKDLENIKTLKDYYNIYEDFTSEYYDSMAILYS